MGWSLLHWSGLVAAWAVLWSVLATMVNSTERVKSIEALLKKPKYIEGWHQNTVSLLHAIFCSVYSIVYLWSYSLPGGAEPIECPDFFHGIEIMFPAAFMGFLVGDLCVVFKPLLSGKLKVVAWDMAVHHLVFLALCGLNCWYKRWCFPFFCLTIGEMSTVFLDLRWAMIGAELTESPSFTSVSILFAGTFFFCRIVLGGYLIHYLLREDTMLFGPLTVWHLAPTALACGFVLNCFWMQGILAAVMKRTEKKE